METHNHLIKSLICLKRPCADRPVIVLLKNTLIGEGKTAYVSTLNLMNHAKFSVAVAITIYFHRLAEDVKEMGGGVLCYAKLCYAMMYGSFWLLSTRET